MAESSDPSPALHTLSDTELAQLQDLLDQVPAPLQALDLCAVDGYLCGVLLQPHAVAPALWLPGVTDADGRALPAGHDSRELHGLVLRRYAQLSQAIGGRQWFDPWIFELDEAALPSETLLPWVAGFAAAMERFPGLMQSASADLLEPLALLYMHFDPEDLDDAQDLQAVIDTLEPPADLAEAVQDIVRSLMLLADVTRPLTPRVGRRPSRPATQAKKRR